MAESSRNMVAIVAIIAIVVLVGIVVWFVREGTNDTLEIDIGTAHRAVDDSEAAGRVLLALAEQMPHRYADLIRLQGRYAARQEAELSALRSRRPS